MRILLIEDDDSLCETIRESFLEAGFVVDAVHDGPTGEEMGKDPEYAAVILDLGLPGRSGLQVLRNWRQEHYFLPVIILTARSSWRERIDGLECGADDYLGKPFHVEELISRIRAMLRRTRTNTQGMLSVGPLSLDERRKQARLGSGQVIPLTATEFRLLRCFMLNRNRVLSKETLFGHLYDVESDHDITVIETHIMRLRKKIGDAWIQTHRGHGYRLSVPEDEDG